MQCPFVSDKTSGALPNSQPPKGATGGRDDIVSVHAVGSNVLVNIAHVAGTFFAANNIDTGTV
jgi:hypothetical protein